MPVRIQNNLPAQAILEDENIFVMTEYRAMHQDIRQLNLLVLNLMPTKEVTETQILRKLSNTPLQVSVEFLQTATYTPTHVDHQHLETFYKTFDEVKDRKFDGMIITGAPVERVSFEDVNYWKELCEIMEWTKSHVHCTMHVCWGAVAGLYYHYGIAKHDIKGKLSGIYEHTMCKPKSPLFRGFDDVFYMPHSRYTEVKREEIEAVPALEVMAVSEKAGVAIVKTTDSRQFFCLAHPEYDADTLKKEYVRDCEKGMDPDVPENYFPDDDPAKQPLNKWRSTGQLLYSNWLNYYVYQSTPYDIRTIGEEEDGPENS